jgi:hypothetical protein
MSFVHVSHIYRWPNDPHRFYKADQRVLQKYFDPEAFFARDWEV